MLQVFELLTQLDPALRGWSALNWQSTIRRYVRIHPDYANMAPWYGRESADITYDDYEGDFTAMLINRGYLEAEEWRNKRPKYYLEVKTTTGPSKTPFYLSKHQYERVSVLTTIGTIYPLTKPRYVLCITGEITQRFT